MISHELDLREHRREHAYTGDRPVGCRLDVRRGCGRRRGRRWRKRLGVDDEHFLLDSEREGLNLAEATVKVLRIPQVIRHVSRRGARGKRRRGGLKARSLGTTDSFRCRLAGEERLPARDHPIEGVAHLFLKWENALTPLCAVSACP